MKTHHGRVFIDAEQSYFQTAIHQLVLELQEQYNRDRIIVYNTYQCYRKVHGLHTKICFLNLCCFILDYSRFGTTRFGTIKKQSFSYWFQTRARCLYGSSIDFINDYSLPYLTFRTFFLSFFIRDKYQGDIFTFRKENELQTSTLLILFIRILQLLLNLIIVHLWRHWKMPKTTTRIKFMSSSPVIMKIPLNLL